MLTFQVNAGFFKVLESVWSGDFLQEVLEVIGGFVIAASPFSSDLQRSTDLGNRLLSRHTEGSKYR